MPPLRLLLRCAIRGNDLPDAAPIPPSESTPHLLPNAVVKGFLERYSSNQACSTPVTRPMAATNSAQLFR